MRSSCDTLARNSDLYGGQCELRGLLLESAPRQLDLLVCGPDVAVLLNEQPGLFVQLVVGLAEPDAAGARAPRRRPGTGRASTRAAARARARAAPSSPRAAASAAPGPDALADAPISSRRTTGTRRSRTATASAADRRGARRSANQVRAKPAPASNTICAASASRKSGQCAHVNIWRPPHQHERRPQRVEAVADAREQARRLDARG